MHKIHTHTFALFCQFSGLAACPWYALWRRYLSLLQSSKELHQCLPVPIDMILWWIKSTEMALLYIRILQIPTCFFFPGTIWRCAPPKVYSAEYFVLYCLLRQLVLSCFPIHLNAQLKMQTEINYKQCFSLCRLYCVNSLFPTLALRD